MCATAFHVYSLMADPVSSSGDGSSVRAWHDYDWEASHFVSSLLSNSLHRRPVAARDLTLNRLNQLAEVSLAHAHVCLDLSWGGVSSLVLFLIASKKEA